MIRFLGERVHRGSCHGCVPQLSVTGVFMHYFKVRVMGEEKAPCQARFLEAQAPLQLLLSSTSFCLGCSCQFNLFPGLTGDRDGLGASLPLHYHPPFPACTERSGDEFRYPELRFPVNIPSAPGVFIRLGGAPLARDPKKIWVTEQRRCF